MRRRLLLAFPAIIAIAALVAASQAADLHHSVLRPTYADDDLLTILVIGSDVGPPQRPGDLRRGRADAIHLLAVDTEGRKATVVDIPRDSVVGGTKVNAHLARGGPEALHAQLQEYTGITIDYWVLTSFQGLENLVTALGGVEVVVEQRMQDPFSGSNFQPGLQRLDGFGALAFSRDRHSVPGGDFGRTRNQGQLLVAAQRQLREEHADLVSLARLIPALARNTVSNIPYRELLPLALLAVDLDPEQVHQVPLRGSLGWLNGQSVVYLHPGDTFDRIRAGEVGSPAEEPAGQ